MWDMGDNLFFISWPSPLPKNIWVDPCSAVLRTSLITSSALRALGLRLANKTCFKAEKTLIDSVYQKKTLVLKLFDIDESQKNTRRSRKMGLFNTSLAYLRRWRIFVVMLTKVRFVFYCLSFIFPSFNKVANIVYVSSKWRQLICAGDGGGSF